MYVADIEDIELLREFYAEAEDRWHEDKTNEQAWWDMEDIEERAHQLGELLR